MGGPAKAKNDVYILKVGNEYRIRPAMVAVDPSSPNNDKLRFRNTTDYPANIVFPAGLINEPNTQTVQRRSWGQVTIKPGAQEVNSYSVFVVVNGQPIQAKGESEPIIIVDQ
jgi:hypothetical protein